jgi:hypothetical protein
MFLVRSDLFACLVTLLVCAGDCRQSYAIMLSFAELERNILLLWREIRQSHVELGIPKGSPSDHTDTASATESGKRVDL